MLDTSDHLLLPDQLAQIRAAISAEPAFNSLWFAVPMELPATTIAMTQPASLWHVGISTSYWLGANFDALSFPDRIVPMAGTDQSVGDLVQDGVPNLLVAVALHEIDRKFNGAPVEYAEAQRLLPAIERK